MSNEVTKDEKLKQLLELGLIEKVEDFGNLSHNQLDVLIENGAKISRPLLTEQEIDKILKSKKGDSVLKTQISQEVVKRRKSDQALKSYKQKLKIQLEGLSNFVK